MCRVSARRLDAPFWRRMIVPPENGRLRCCRTVHGFRNSEEIPGVIGRQVRLNGNPFAIVGVLGAGFHTAV
jgi:hypothetical protein